MSTIFGSPWKEPKSAPCPGCGNTLELAYSFTNLCDACGQYTDGFGRPVRPPEEWEEPWDED